MFRHLLVASTLVATAVTAAPAVADDAPPPATPSTYAIVVGSNAGGPGQTDLHYAEDDARKVAALLVELGGYRAGPASTSSSTRRPTSCASGSTKLAERVAADAAAGRQSRVFFYYSGHARAPAIDLGADELPLDELRKRLFERPGDAHRRRARRLPERRVLAHQGRRSRPPTSRSARASTSMRPASPCSRRRAAASCRRRASSCAAAYFTHHLLVGLRGAGDANGDGQVSIDEAYRYAYHQTLLATAETAVGGQHVSFEADLKGHGEVPLSFPRAATRAIVLPRALEGQTLVEDKRAHAVVAETYKAKGAPVRIAVAPGDYERARAPRRPRSSRCDVGSGGEVDLAQLLDRDARRDAPPRAARSREPTRSSSTRMRRRRARRRLHAEPRRVRLRRRTLASGGRLAGRRGCSHVAPYVWVGGLASEVEPAGVDARRRRARRRRSSTGRRRRSPRSARAELPVGSDGALARLALYGQVGGGLGIGHAHFSGADGETNDAHLRRLRVHRAAPGCTSTSRRRFGVSAGYQFDYAPVVNDLIGNTHAARRPSRCSPASATASKEAHHDDSSPSASRSSRRRGGRLAARRDRLRPGHARPRLRPVVRRPAVRVEGRARRRRARPDLERGRPRRRAASAPTPRSSSSRR